MGLFPEKETKASAVKEVAEEPTALNIERKEVIAPIPTQFKAQVNDDNGKPIITTPQNQKIQITIPAINKEELEKDSKTTTERTTSWNASFLLRIILKAIHFGKRVMFKK